MFRAAAVRLLVSSFVEPFRQGWYGVKRLVHLSRALREVLGAADVESTKALAVVRPPMMDPLPGGLRQVIDQDTLEALAAVIAAVQSAYAIVRGVEYGFERLAEWRWDQSRSLDAFLESFAVDEGLHGIPGLIRLARAVNGGKMPPVSPALWGYFGIGVGITSPCSSAVEFRRLVKNWDKDLHREAKRPPYSLPTLRLLIEDVHRRHGGSLARFFAGQTGSESNSRECPPSQPVP